MNESVARYLRAERTTLIELLVFAAKAAEIDHVDYSNSDYDGCLGLQMVDSVGRHTGTWNPYKDNAQSFELAAFLGLDVEFHGLIGAHPFACASDCSKDIQEEVQLNSGDIMQTARLCILKAAGEIAGSINRDGYVLIRVYRKLYLAHRLAWLYMTGKEPKNLVDHIDRNPGNNKWDNLREATYSQNEMNRGPAYCNRTGIKGVMPTKHGTYRAFVVKDKVQHARSFKTLNEAEQWVKMKRKTLHLDRATDI